MVFFLPALPVVNASRVMEGIRGISAALGFYLDAGKRDVRRARSPRSGRWPRPGRRSIVRSRVLGVSQSGRLALFWLTSSQRPQTDVTTANHVIVGLQEQRYGF
jgi:hypothetical protein